MTPQIVHTLCPKKNHPRHYWF